MKPLAARKLHQGQRDEQFEAVKRLARAILLRLFQDVYYDVKVLKHERIDPRKQARTCLLQNSWRLQWCCEVLDLPWPALRDHLLKKLQEPPESVPNRRWSVSGVGKGFS